MSEYKIITPDSLAKVALLPQALDNQWLPEMLLGKVYNKGLSLQDVENERVQSSRVEWLRALLYSEQVVLNRAYLFNNAAIYNQFTDPKGIDSKAFRVLLEHNVIIPFLYTENPGEMPQGFGVSKDGWDGWNAIGGNERATFVKLSLDNEVNGEEIKKLGASYRAYFTGLLTDDEIGPLIFREFCDNAQEATSCYEYYFERVRSLENEILAYNKNHPNEKPKQIAREVLYGKFLWNTDDFNNVKNPNLRRFDPAKKYASQLKKIFDLKYNVNLPDFLDRYPITPFGMPERTTLHDELLLKQSGKDIDPAEIIKAIRRIAVSKTLSGAFLKTVGLLTLSDILSIRGLSDENLLSDAEKTNQLRGSWRQYIDIQRKVVDKPLDFPELAPTIEKNFVNLNRNITDWLLPRLRSEMITKSQPYLKYVFEAGSQTLEIASIPVSDIETKLLMKVTGNFIKYAGPWITGKIVVAGLAKAKSQTDMQLSFHFMHKQLNQTKKAWDSILDETRASRIFTEVEEFPTEESPNINLPQ